MARSININQLVDDQKVGSFVVTLVVLGFLAMLADGYDILALAISAPAIIKDWGVDRAAFGPAFSASLFGILFGAPILGWVSDRFGRKKAIVSGGLIFGAFTLACVWATSLQELVALRFLTGIGLGGLLPNTIALIAEYAPKRWRATSVIVMFSGITLGGAVPGWLAPELLPAYGWQALFVVGGLGPIVIALLLALVLPESIKYLVLRGGRNAEAAKLASRLSGEAIAADTAFTIEGGKKTPFTPALLFSGGLAAITPLLWILFASNLMANYFINSWIVTVFPATGRHDLLMFQVCGTIGGILISFLLDRTGFVPIVILFLCGAISVSLIGQPGLPDTTHTLIVGAAGFCVLGVQFGINAISGMIYPTAFRSNGSGWAFAIGRFGSVIGPLLGGYLLAMQLPPQNLFYAPAISLALGFVASLILLRCSMTRFRGLTIDDKAAG